MYEPIPCIESPIRILLSDPRHRRVTASIYRGTQLQTSASGADPQEAVAAAVRYHRIALRCERASLALDRAGQSVHAQLAKLSALAIAGV